MGNLGNVRAWILVKVLLLPSLGAIKVRRKATVNALRRSLYGDVSEKLRECDRETRAKSGMYVTANQNIDDTGGTFGD